MSLRAEHVRRYGQLARLLVKYGRSDVVRTAGLDDVEPDDLWGDDGEASVDVDVLAHAEELTADLEALGPTYVKLGQLLSTRADLLPPAYLQALGRLQDDVEPIPFPEVEEVLQRELGPSGLSRFAHVEPVPLASASIGQVHRATLHDGRQVAVKVQRPGLRSTITADLEVLGAIADRLDAHTEIGRVHGLSDLLEQFRRTLLAELDYRAEARNLRTMADHLAEFEDLEVPLPVGELSTVRVLTMDFVEGVKIRDAAVVPRGDELARELFEAYLEQILANGFVHADPHPGNVLLTDDGRLSLIDLGMVTRLDPHLRHKLLTLLIALGSGRGHDVAEIAEDISEPLDGYDPETFRTGVADLVGRHGDGNVGEVGAGTVLTQLMQLCGEARLRLPPALSMVGKAMLNLDDVTRALDPTFAPQELMQDYGEKLLRREMTDMHGLSGMLGPIVEMRDLLETLPRRTQSIVDQIAAGEFTVKVDALDEQELLQGAQKIANRVTVGLLLAAMIVGAAMTMNVDTASTLFGYPSISIVFFVAAGLGAAALMASILFGDRRSRRR